MIFPFQGRAQGRRQTCGGAARRRAVAGEAAGKADVILEKFWKALAEGWGDSLGRGVDQTA
jgi:hypothetical protein